MLLKNVASQGMYIYSYDTVNKAPKTGDAANTTGYYALDGGTPAAFATAGPTEASSTHMPGVYWQPLAQAETNGNLAAYAWTSTTAGVQIDPVLILTTGASLPTAAPAAAGGLLTVGTGAGQIGPDGTGSVPIAFGTALPTSPSANTVGEALFLADVTGGRVNTAQGGTSSTITLDSGASSDAGAYIGDDVYLYGGTGGGIRGAGQRRTIVAYNASTKVATVQRGWDTTPDGTTKFITLPQPQANVGLIGGTSVVLDGNGYLGVNLVDLAGVPASYYNGLAQGGTANTITLAAGEVANPLWRQIELVSGTGTGQAALCTGFNTSTKVATISYLPGGGGNWTTVPDATTYYAIGDLTPLISPAGAIYESGPFKIDVAAGFEFPMFLSGDSSTGYAGGAVSGTRSIAGGADTAVGGTIAQIGATNRYYFSGTASDFNGTNITFTFTASGAGPTIVSIDTTP